MDLIERLAELAQQGKVEWHFPKNERSYGTVDGLRLRVKNLPWLTTSVIYFNIEIEHISDAYTYNFERGLLPFTANRKEWKQALPIALSYRDAYQQWKEQQDTEGLEQIETFERQALDDLANI